MAISTNIVNTLGAGSGVDVKSLALQLAEVEITPRKDLINTKITQTEAKISAYGYINVALSDLKNAFAKLDDAADFASISPTVSQPNALGITTNFSAQTGNFNLQVSNIATAQSSASAGYAARDSQLNGGEPFKLSLQIGSGDELKINIKESNTTPAGLVRAINGANLGVNAQLLDTGDSSNPYKVVVTGQTGAANSFTLSALDSDDNAIEVIDFSTQLQAADDARLSLNGMAVTRSSNQV
ncbi:MAG: flagellar filament capping protein FliD, partial [Hylemonella sp.]